jgi:hypothetical protein
MPARPVPTALSTVRLAALCLCAAAGPALARTTSVAYVSPSFANAYAYVVDWDSAGTAHVASPYGASTGTYAVTGAQSLVTLATPLDYLEQATDCNGQPFTQQYATTQLVFRQDGGNVHSGASEVVEIGTITDLGGCTPGHVTSYGSPTDPGYPMRNLDMALRAGEGDVVPGAQLAGLTDGALPIFLPGGSLGPGVTTATFGTGTVTFAASGVTDPYAMVDGWIVIDLPDGSQRAYTRLKNAPGGLQSWLVTDWADGSPGLVQSTLVATPDSAAGFGGLSTQAHQWQSGLFIGSGLSDVYDLYTDFTGEWTYGSQHEFTHVAITWAMSGPSMHTYYTNFQGAHRDRTWTPIANDGRNHFVFESEIQTLDGVTMTLTPPRVNFLIDQGPASQ